MNSKEWLIGIACDREVTGEMLRVLLVVLATLETSSSSPVSQAEIGELLGMKRQNVNQAINRLVRKGILEKRVQGGKITGYRIRERLLGSPDGDL